MMDDRQFKGVWIPADVWLDCDLSMTEKALLAEIDSFTGNGKSFYKSNETIVKEYQVSRSTIARAVKKLGKLGYIEVKTDGRHRYLSSRLGRVVKMKRQGSHNDDAGASKRRATNTKERTKENTIKKREVVMPFTEPEFEKYWNEWKEYKSVEHKFRFKSPASEQAQLHQLQKLSNNNMSAAVLIIGQSIANGWKGLFQIKQNNEPIGTTDGSLIAAHIRNLGTDS